MPKPKKIVIMADLHCGHRAGLAHPSFQVSAGTPKGKRIKAFQQEMWRGFAKMLKSVGHIDLAVWNGDLIDGRGERSGGTELVTTDREEQCDGAVRIIEHVSADKNLVSAGTPYHSGQLEDWESSIARAVGTTLNSHLFVDANGLVFDVKHKVGGSTIPHGRFTAVARERLWNLIWSGRQGGQPKAAVIVRSHVHYHAYCGQPGYLAMTTPALQAAWTKYGARQCSGTVDFGFVTFTVANKETWSWRSHLLPLAAVKQEAVKA